MRRGGMSWLPGELLPLSSHFGGIQEHNHGPDNFAAAGVDGGDAVVDRKFAVVAGNQQAVVPLVNNPTFAQSDFGDIFDRQPGSFVNYSQHTGEGPTFSFRGRPTREFFGNWIKGGNVAGGVSSDYGIADRL